MEKLGQLAATGQWDLIVVDTPPSRSALDFLDAPQRMSTFLDGRMIRLLSSPARAGGRGLRKIVGGRVHAVREGGVDDPGRPDARRRLGVRAGLRHDVRRLPGARHGHLRAAALAGHRVPGGGRARAGRAARGRLLRRPALRRGDAAGRARAQPHPPGAARTSRRRQARGVAEDLRGAPLAAAVLRLHADRVDLAEREERLLARFTGAHPTVAVTQGAGGARRWPTWRAARDRRRCWQRAGTAPACGRAATAAAARRTGGALTPDVVRRA